MSLPISVYGKTSWLPPRTMPIINPPGIGKEIWDVVRQLKQEGLSILIIDKDLKTLLEIASRYYLMEKGCIVSTGTGQHYNNQQVVLNFGVKNKIINTNNTMD